jgi:hypothetical protein
MNGLTVPKPGTYRATDGAAEYRFTIDKDNPPNPDIGDIRGTYWTHGSEMGEWESKLGDYPGKDIQPERSSSYSWLAEAEHEPRLNQPPFLIRIVGTTSRTDGTEYKHCQHTWTGVYLADDSIRMSGTECYVTFTDGQERLSAVHVINLPQLTFKLSS